jgi:hypothetical protein
VQRVYTDPKQSKRTDPETGYCDDQRLKIR